MPDGNERQAIRPDAGLFSLKTKTTYNKSANFLKVPLPYLLLEKDQHMSVVRKQERKFTVSQDADLKVEHLASQGGLSLRLVDFPPGSSTGESIAHEGEECHLVLKGQILAEQGEDSYILGEGDTFSWSAMFLILLKISGMRQLLF